MKESGIPLSALPPVPLDEFIRQFGVSATTAWRYRKKGWLVTLNISGRHYLSRESIANFLRRAESGEFSKMPRNPGRDRE